MFMLWHFHIRVLCVRGILMFDNLHCLNFETMMNYPENSSLGIINVDPPIDNALAKQYNPKSKSTGANERKISIENVHTQIEPEKPIENEWLLATWENFSNFQFGTLRFSYSFRLYSSHKHEPKHQCQRDVMVAFIYFIYICAKFPILFCWDVCMYRTFWFRVSARIFRTK